VIEVLATGPLATLQDLGRPGYADVGVSPSGAADPVSHRLANRLLANPEQAATIEVTLGGLALRSDRDCWIAVTGAPVPLRVGPREEGVNAPVHLPAGHVVALGTADTGLRSYLAVRGGFGVTPVLGSRSTDSLGGVGPAPLRIGDRLPVLPPPTLLPHVDLAPVAALPDVVQARLEPGPRADWLHPESLARLVDGPWHVSVDTSRMGVRLEGVPLVRDRDGELAPEGVVRGAVQVPPNGRPIVFLADHPVTGGYPVVAVVRSADLSGLAQARPGQPVRLRWAQPRPQLDLSSPSSPTTEELP
jgi:biotin-dependent carboxylase-like uncharacterized protein